MTDASTEHLRLPVDDSPPRERLRWPMLAAVAAIVLLLHLALVTVFTPLAPGSDQSESAADRSMLFISSQAAANDPQFLKMVDTYDPIAFLHPREEVGFSFFRATRDEFALDTPAELPVPAKPAELEPLPVPAIDPVVRPLVREVAESDADWDAASPETAIVSYPYCVADSQPDAVFPAIPLVPQMERVLRRSPPALPSVFVLESPASVLQQAANSDPAPLAVILSESCGVAELDLAARAWLDTLLNSGDVPGFQRIPGRRCRVVWSAAALEKEPSVR